MRTIKFRAWQKHHKEMFEVAAISFVSAKSAAFVVKKAPSGFNVETWTLDEVELMQFTGLTDKHGKDIYEGDIVLGFDSGHYGKLQKMRIEYRLHPFIGFYMVPADGLRPHLFGEGDDIEIIGNIYENPELLEDEGDPHA